MIDLSIAALAAALTTFRLTSASCLLQNRMDPGSESEAVTKGLCVRQAEGNYHLSFSSSSVCVPALAAGGMSGCSGGPGWKLFDWNCKLLGDYDPGQDKNCVAPYEIHYFPGKPVNINHSWQITYDPSFRPTHSSTIGAITAPSPMVSAVRANRISASLLSASVELASPVLRPARLRVFRTVPRVSSLLILHYARRRMLAMFRLHWKQWIP